MSLSGHFKIHHWPGFTFVLFIFTFILSYLIAVLDGHVYEFFPFISDSGAERPESCIFAQLMNLGALSMAITLYIRYRQVDFGITSGHIDAPRKWNKVSLWLSGVISLGISITGNFQETAVIVVHLLGAFMAFGIGSFYFCIQTRISFGTISKLNCESSRYGIGRKTLFLRTFLVLCFFLLLSFIGICGTISMTKFTGKTINWWTEEDGGFEYRLVATFAEWILAIFLLLYILTYTNEFKALEFQDFTFINKYSNLKTEPQEEFSEHHIAKV